MDPSDKNDLMMLNIDNYIDPVNQTTDMIIADPINFRNQHNSVMV